MVREIFICCGDPSGDLHASKLTGTLKKIQPGLKVSGAGGNKLKSACDNFLIDLVGMNLHGYWEPLLQYRRIKGIFNGIIVKHLMENRPDAVIAVDFYGFNIRLCETAHSLKIPVYYYISPQVWATRPGRIKRLKNCVDKMFVIFPFEEKIYKDSGVNAVFLGHPMLDDFPQPVQEKPATNSPVIGLFPGSRKQVIRWNLPMMLETARIIREKLPGSKFVIAGFEEFKECYSGAGGIELVFDRSYERRKKLDAAISVSGTVTLENALLGIPMVVCYKLPQLMYYIVKSMTRLNFVTMVNLINGTEAVKEFIQSSAQPEKIAGAAINLITSGSERKNMLAEYTKMRGLLGQPGSVERIAKLLIGEISNVKNN